MLNYLKTLISIYGQNVTITFKDESENKNKSLKAQAFIQPLRSDYQSPLYGDYNPDTTTEQFLYIGMADIKLCSCPSDTIIETSSEKYEIKKVESVYLGKKILYERAVLEISTK